MQQKKLLIRNFFSFHKTSSIFLHGFSYQIIEGEVLIRHFRLEKCWLVLDFMNQNS